MHYQNSLVVSLNDHIIERCQVMNPTLLAIQSIYLLKKLKLKNTMLLAQEGIPIVHVVEEPIFLKI